MMRLPSGDRALLVRTSFADDEAWKRVVAVARSESPEGFVAILQTVDEPSFEGIEPTVLADEVRRRTEHTLVVIADAKTMGDAEMLLLCVDPLPPGGQFRVVPGQLWSVENNVSLANMDFAEYLTALDRDGVFRGFSG